MYPDDRVLVGVINRKRDYRHLHDDHWYRIPQQRMRRGIHTEYLAFFLSGKVFGDQSGTIPCYARLSGLELTYRRDLLPKEADHPRANDVYYKVQLGKVQEKTPPITNPTRRPITFVFTTWDRFVQARTISDLYSEADYYVDRVYHALRSKGIRAERFWEAEKRETGYGAQLRVLCESGTLVASNNPDDGGIYLDNLHQEDAILAAIYAEIAKQGGPVTIDIPFD
ncbi:MAG: hypothetical protein K8L99_03605 [Anaerolineae bacterium]|nr:hypothetical protein [Anaerolineae bacterium]